jgi:hypothetical protein
VGRAEQCCAPLTRKRFHIVFVSCVYWALRRVVDLLVAVVQNPPVTAGNQRYIGAPCGFGWSASTSRQPAKRLVLGRIARLVGFVSP